MNEEVKIVVEADFAVEMALHYLESLQYGNSVDDIAGWISDDVLEHSFKAVKVEEEEEEDPESKPC